MESGDQSMKQFLVPHSDDAGAETAVLDTGEAMLVDHAWQREEDKFLGGGMYGR